MPSYVSIKRWMDSAEKLRTADRLLALRRKLKSEITDRAEQSSLLIATWNLRDFDSNRLGHGQRLRESYYYIAEIVSAFDLVVLQEVNRNLEALELLLSILGAEWDYIATDAIEASSGTPQRVAFVFRQSKIMFRKIAGEIVLPGGRQQALPAAAAHLPKPELQFVRAPFLAAFQVGDFKFNLCTMHIDYRDAKGEGLQQNLAQLERIAEFLRERQEREREHFILLGDFGIGAPSDLMARVLDRSGFDIPEALTKRRIKADDHYYDQIAFRVQEDRLELAGAGAFRFFDSVFRDNDEDFEAYQELMPEEKANDLWNGGPRGYYADQWRSWQMSDHLPLWVELKVDFADRYLDMIRKSANS